MFKHKWCFNSLVAEELFLKLRVKHKDVEFIESEDIELAKHY